jgi:hypothetical protein
MLFASGLVVTGGGSCVRVCVCVFRSFVVVIEGNADAAADDVLSFRATS